MAEDGAGPHGYRYLAGDLGLAGKIEAWLSANGVTHSQEDGSLVVTLAMEEVTLNLLTAI
jgi:hypothetical protein